MKLEPRVRKSLTQPSVSVVEVGSGRIGLESEKKFCAREVSTLFLLCCCGDSSEKWFFFCNTVAGCTFGM